MPRLRLMLPAGVLLTLVGLFFGLLSTRPERRIDFGSADDSRFVYGFYQAEEGAGAVFRWSGPEARLMLHGATSAAQALRLRISGERLVDLGTPEIRLEQNGTTLVAFDVSKGWRTYSVLLPAGSASDLLGNPQPIYLTSETTRPGSAQADLRPLGVPVDWIELAQPENASLGENLLRALMLGWLIAVIGGAYAWAERTIRPQLNGTWWRASVLIALLGAPVAWLLQRDANTLLWLLPPLPWLLGLLSVMLLSSVWLRPITPPAWLAWAGFGILALANLILNSRSATAIGIGMALLGLSLLVKAGFGQTLWATAESQLSPRQIGLALAAIFGVALAMRFALIDQLPFGLWRDEARHGLFALRIRDYDGYRPIYIASERVNMPALGLYPFALALHVFGIHLWSMRVVTAFAGALTVLPLYALVSRISGRRDLGLLAATLLAVSSWHITISRFSFPTVFDSLFGLSGLWLIWRSLGPQAWAARWRLPALALAGICLGLAVQTYHTGRVVPVVGAVLAVAILARAPRQWRSWLISGVALAFGLGITVWPLVDYALNRPQDFNDRVSDVFLLSEEALKAQAPLGALDDALRRHLLMFNVEGDANGRHHAPLRPLLDYFTGVLFLAGMAGLLVAWRDPRSLFLITALGLSAAPSALAVDAPHAMRSFGVAAFACAVAALGAAELWRRLNLAAQAHTLRRGIVGVGLSATLLFNVWVYFVVMPPNGEVWVSFYPVQSQVGKYLREQPAAELEHIFVPQVLNENPVFTFMTHGLAVQTFEGLNFSRPPQSGDRIVLGGYFYADEAQQLSPYLGANPEPIAIGPMFPDGRAPSYVIYRVP